MALVSPFQQYPDLAHMSAEHFSEFVASCQLGSWEKNELKGLSVQERNRYYIDHVYWPRLVDTRNVVRDAHVHLMKTGIFLRPEIKDRFTKLSEMVWEALAEDEFHQQHRDIRPEVREKRDDLRKHGEGLLKELESIVNARLWGRS